MWNWQNNSTTPEGSSAPTGTTGSAPQNQGAGGTPNPGHPGQPGGQQPGQQGGQELSDMLQMLDQGGGAGFEDLNMVTLSFE